MMATVVLLASIGLQLSAAGLAAQPGGRLSLSAADLEVPGLAARLHDIGKIGVRESVLNKPGSRTPEELDHVKPPPSLGAQILGPLAEDRRLIEGVPQHHENWVGTGSSLGLAGDDIPLLASGFPEDPGLAPPGERGWRRASVRRGLRKS